MKIIVESGATKSDWRLVDECGYEKARVMKAGINVSTMQRETIEKVIAEALNELPVQSLDGLYLYVAGVVTAEIRKWLVLFVNSKVQVRDFDVQNDLMAAARAVCGHESGIVAIMGTGSNTCFYDGSTVSQKVYSGGYVLGDDGSASVLGRLFISDFIKELVPKEIAKAFSASFASDYASIVENVYHSQSPSGYLGSIAPFILSHYDNPYIKRLVDENFKAFIHKSLLRYDTASFGVGVVGGFGNACRNIFTPLAEASGIRIIGYMPAPVEGLKLYHCR